MSFLFIINPHSGTVKGKKKLTGLIQKSLANPYIVYTQFAGHACELAKKGVSENIPFITAVGGDGTINEVASALVNTNSALGIIPMGSGNGFARSLNIPVNINEALNVIIQKKVISIDVGRINENYFFGVAGVGLDAQIGHRFLTNKFRGPLPYFYLGLKEYFKYEFPVITLVNGQEKQQFRPLVMTFANGAQYGNGAQIAPHADLSDGLLDICIIGKMSFLHSLLSLTKLFSGKIKSIKAYQTFPKRRFEVFTENDEEILYHIDGEPRFAKKKLEVSLQPKALKVITI